MFSSPFLGTFFQYIQCIHSTLDVSKPFSSPFLGTFFQSAEKPIKVGDADGFRPLSWGLSFNKEIDALNAKLDACFRPLSWGLSFNKKVNVVLNLGLVVFVPFLGDFLSITRRR